MLTSLWHAVMISEFSLGTTHAEALKQLVTIIANSYLNKQELFRKIKRISQNSFFNSQQHRCISVLAWQTLTQGCAVFYYPQAHRTHTYSTTFVADIFVTLQYD